MYCRRNLCLHLIKTKLARKIKMRTIDESKFGIFKQLDYDVEYFSRVPTYKILNNNQPSKLGQNLKKKSYYLYCKTEVRRIYTVYNNIPRTT